MADTASRNGAIAQARKYMDDGTFVEELGRRVAIKTESQKFPDASALAACDQYLESEMKPAFEAMGFIVKRYDNPFKGQGPVLLATRIEDAKLPTVLGYGHGDVVRGIEDQWTKGQGPWVVARDGERLYGAEQPTTKANTPSTWRRSARSWPNAAAISASMPNS